MLRMCIITLLLVMPGLRALASTWQSADYAHPQHACDSTDTFARAIDSSIGQASVAGGSMIILGQVARAEDNKYRNLRTDYLPTPEHSHDYYLQLAPAALMLGLKACGVKSESTWSQMLVADAAALAIMSGTVEGLKHAVDEPRPDGSDVHSFPSGHTATAFMTATMLHHEYGRRYPWLSVLGYGLASTTAFLRVYDNRHWVGDVMTGAGIGTISTELGYIVSDLIFRRPILKDCEYFSRGVEDYCPSFFSYYVSYDMSKARYAAYGDRTLKLSNGCTVGVEGAWFPVLYVGIGAKAKYSDFKAYVDDVPQTYPIKYATAMAGVYNSTPITPRLALGFNMLAGYGRYESVDITDGQQTATHYDSRAGIALSAGISLVWRLSESMSYRIFTDINRMPRPSVDADRLKVISIGAQVAVNF